MTGEPATPSGAPHPRVGFALPLAFFALIALALLIALLFDSGVQEVRAGRADEAYARAHALRERLLADLLAGPADSGLAAAPAGVIRLTTFADAGDSGSVAIQTLGGGTVRVVIAARSWIGVNRADAGGVAFLRVQADSSVLPASLRFRRLPGWWWSPAQ